MVISTHCREFPLSETMHANPLVPFDLIDDTYIPSYIEFGSSSDFDSDFLDIQIWIWICSQDHFSLLGIWNYLGVARDPDPVERCKGFESSWMFSVQIRIRIC